MKTSLSHFVWGSVVLGLLSVGFIFVRSAFRFPCPEYRQMGHGHGATLIADLPPPPCAYVFSVQIAGIGVLPIISLLFLGIYIVQLLRWNALRPIDRLFLIIACILQLPLFFALIGNFIVPIS